MIRAKKGCRFAGKNYSAGDAVPESAIDAKAIGALLRMKIIERVADEVKKAAEEIKPQPQTKPKVSKATKAG